MSSWCLSDAITSSNVPQSLFLIHHLHHSPSTSIREYMQAVLKLYAIPLGSCQKKHHLSRNQDDLFQIYNNVAIAGFEFKKFVQLSQRLFFDLATEDEHLEVSSHCSFDPENHGTRECNRIPKSDSLKTGIEKGRALTEVCENARFWAFDAKSLTGICISLC